MRVFLIYLLLSIIASYAKTTPITKDSAKFSIFSIDEHDIEQVVIQNAQSLLESDFIKGLKSTNMIAISDIENLTDEYIDVEILGRKIMRIVAKSSKLILTNAIAGSGIKTDKGISIARNLNKNELFNPYTTQEGGTLIAPSYSLSGKITQDVKAIDNHKRVDYRFLLVVTDLKNGRVVWDNDVLVSKIIDKDNVKKYANKGNSQSKHIKILQKQCNNGNVENVVRVQT